MWSVPTCCLYRQEGVYSYCLRPRATNSLLVHGYWSVVHLEYWHLRVVLSSYTASYIKTLRIMASAYPFRYSKFTSMYWLRITANNYTALINNPRVSNAHRATTSARITSVVNTHVIQYHSYFHLLHFLYTYMLGVASTFRTHYICLGLRLSHLYSTADIWFTFTNRTSMSRANI